MYKVRFNTTDGHITETTMPIIPRPGDNVGLWIKNDSIEDKTEEWVIAEVDYLVYEFDEDNSFLFTEINLGIEFDEKTRSWLCNTRSSV